MIAFVDTPHSWDSVTGCHGSHAFSHIPIRLIYVDFFFAFRGSQETIWHQFKIFLGVQGMSNKFQRVDSLRPKSVYL